MIYEPTSYKEELRKIYVRMHSRMKQKRWIEQSYFLLEKDFFFGFFIIRKIIEGGGDLGKEMSKHTASLTRYEAFERSNFAHNYNYNPDLFYSINSSGDVLLKDLVFLCNQAVHSCVFCPILSEEGLDSILLNSLNEKDKAVYRVKITDLNKIFCLFGNRRTYNSTKLTSFT